jgi:hypothetical protein
MYGTQAEIPPIQQRVSRPAKQTAKIGRKIREETKWN